MNNKNNLDRNINQAKNNAQRSSQSKSFNNINQTNFRKQTSNNKVDLNRLNPNPQRFNRVESNFRNTKIEINFNNQNFFSKIIHHSKFAMGLKISLVAISAIAIIAPIVVSIDYSNKINGAQSSINNRVIMAESSKAFAEFKEELTKNASKSKQEQLNALNNASIETKRSWINIENDYGQNLNHLYDDINFNFVEDFDIGNWMLDLEFEWNENVLISNLNDKFSIPYSRLPIKKSNQNIKKMIDDIPEIWNVWSEDDFEAKIKTNNLTFFKNNDVIETINMTTTFNSNKWLININYNMKDEFKVFVDQSTTQTLTIDYLLKINAQWKNNAKDIVKSWKGPDTAKSEDEVIDGVTANNDIAGSLIELKFNDEIINSEKYEIDFWNFFGWGYFSGSNEQMGLWPNMESNNRFVLHNWNGNRWFSYPASYYQ